MSIDLNTPLSEHFKLSEFVLSQTAQRYTAEALKFPGLGEIYWRIG